MLGGILFGLDSFGPAAAGAAAAAERGARRRAARLRCVDGRLASSDLLTLLGLGGRRARSRPPAPSAGSDPRPRCRRPCSCSPCSLALLAARPPRSAGRPGRTSWSPTTGARLHVEVDEVPGAAADRGARARVHRAAGGVRAAARDAARPRPGRALRPARPRPVRLGRRRGTPRSTSSAATSHAVLDRHAPTGPVVLLGHSHGRDDADGPGARQHPDLFGGRVAGVFLLATSAGDLATGGLARALSPGSGGAGAAAALAVVAAGRRRRCCSACAGRAPGRATSSSGATCSAATTPTRRRCARCRTCSSRRRSRSARRSTRPSCSPRRDGGAAGAVRRAGHRPRRRQRPAHARRAQPPDGRGSAPRRELVVVPGAGHSVNITRRGVVDDALLALLDRARAAYAA